jgi:hypothetical protein
MINDIPTQNTISYCSSKPFNSVVILGGLLQENDFVSNFIKNGLKFRLSDQYYYSI